MSERYKQETIETALRALEHMRVSAEMRVTEGCARVDMRDVETVNYWHREIKAAKDAIGELGKGLAPLAGASFAHAELEEISVALLTRVDACKDTASKWCDNPVMLEKWERRGNRSQHVYDKVRKQWPLLCDPALCDPAL
jgi:hypothetical protein